MYSEKLYQWLVQKTKESGDYAKTLVPPDGEFHFGRADAFQDVREYLLDQRQIEIDQRDQK